MDYLDDIDPTVPGFGDLYDELPLWSAPFGLLLLDRVLMRPDLTVLELGCGTGFLAVELAERCGPGSKIIAVDPWTAAVERLRRKIEAWNLDNIVVLEQHACRIALPDESVDVVVSNLGINNFDDPVGILRKCHGAAKSGGKLLFTTNLSGHMAEFNACYGAVLRELGAKDSLAALEAHVARRGTVDSVGTLVQSAGFTMDEVVTDSFRMRFANGSALLRHHFVRLGFVPGWKSVAELGRIREMFERLEAALNAMAEERGELALTIPVALVVAHKA